MAETVLYLVDSLGLSGKTLSLVNIALRLDPARYRAIVASFSPPEGMLVERLRAHGIQVEHVPCKDGLNADVISRLMQLLRRTRPVMIHGFNPRPMLYGALAAALAARPAVGTLSAFACMSARQHYAWLPQPLQTKSLRNQIRNRVVGHLLSRLVAVSRRAGERFCTDNAIERRKLSVIGYGVDVDGLRRISADDVFRMRDQLGVRPGEVLVGSVGRLVEQKDYPTLLRALALASRQVPVRMVIAGGGPLEAELRALADALGIGDRVCWLGERSEVWTLLRALDVFVITSKFEPFGVAVLEAMAAGLPIIATDVNELSEILDGGRAGLLLPAQRPDSVARALLDVSSDRDLRTRLGTHAHSLAATRYSLPSVVSAYQNLYDDVIEERHG